MNKIFLFLLFNLIFISSYSQLSFKDVSSSLSFNHTYFSGISGAGVSFVDFDNDGLDDISIPTNDNSGLYIYKNNLTYLSHFNINIDYPYQTKQILWIDFDNDNDKDLYLTSYDGINKLFQNNGFFNFIDITSSFNLPDSIANSFGASWADINNDGYLDLVQSYRAGDTISNAIKIYFNDQGKSFIDFTKSSKISEIFKAPFCASFIDIDNNFIPDLYIVSDRKRGNSLYYNNNDSTFTDISNSSNTGVLMDGMSITIGDFNNDNYFDIYSTNIEEGNKFFINNGDLTFTESAEIKGVSFNSIGWGAQFEDFNIDGYEDLYVSGSIIGSQINSSAYFSNIFGKYFEQYNIDGLQIDTVESYGNATGDINNDGYPDIVVLNKYPSNSFIFKNLYSGQNNWLKISLVGEESNKDAYGSRVLVYVNNFSLMRGVFSSEGYLSQNSDDLFFGLGENQIVDSLIVYWPSGLTEIIYNLDINKKYIIHEGSSSLPPKIFYSNNFFCDGESSILETGIFDKYLWSTGDTTKSIEIVEGGEYFVNVFDSNGNVYTSDTVEIKSQLPPAFNIDVKNITNQHTSSVKIIDIDFSKDYYVSLDNGKFEKNKFEFFNISSGSHSISLRNEKGCLSSLTFKIENLLKSSNNPDFSNKSIARKWNEVLLDAIRNDLARPPVHARNLFHLSSIFYDAFVINEKVLNQKNLSPYLLNKIVNGSNFPFIYPDKNNDSDDEYLEKIISYSSYNFIKHRFKNSVGQSKTIRSLDSLMVSLDYDIDFYDNDYTSGDPKSIGVYLFELYKNYGFIDNSNEINDYSSNYYSPINPPLNLDSAGNPSIIDPNRWQPLLISNFIDQSGNPIDGIPEFISPEWGNVLPFALQEDDLSIKVRDDNIYKVYHDPGLPPMLDTANQGKMDSLFKSSFLMVSVWGSHLDRSDGVLWDISPNSIGNLQSLPDDFLSYNSIYNYFNGGDIGTGHDINPHTNRKYDEQIVPRGDYARVLAEFWADGPDSETPPGHWFVILNYVNDNDKLVKKFEGKGDVLSDIEWDIKSYFLLGGAMHDVAISAWGIKGYYDYVRPVSAIRYLSNIGQSSNSMLPKYNLNGIALVDDFIEIVDYNDKIIGLNNENYGKIKLFTWKGFSYDTTTNVNERGSGWILGESWWPYQRPSFVTPPFAGYVSGHSTYSRAAATILEKITGEKYFPGGIGEFVIPNNNFLVFEQGPSIDMKLQWATYKDAADQCALSRIWGGIHPFIDDIPGRKIGEIIGEHSFNFGKSFFLDKTPLSKIEKNINKLNVFPNPITKDKNLTILNESEKSIIKLEIFNYQGQLVLENNTEFQNEKNQFNINKLSPGIYLLRVYFNDFSTLTTKIFISR